MGDKRKAKRKKKMNDEKQQDKTRQDKREKMAEDRETTRCGGGEKTD